MKAIGILLIVIGLIGFALGGVSFTRSEEVADLGGIEIEREESRYMDFAPLASGATVAAGVILLIIGSMKPKDHHA